MYVIQSIEVEPLYLNFFSIFDFSFMLQFCLKLIVKILL